MAVVEIGVADRVEDDIGAFAAGQSRTLSATSVMAVDHVDRCVGVIFIGLVLANHSDDCVSARGPDHDRYAVPLRQSN